MADSILDHPIISSRYFFPQPATLAEPYWVTAADGSRLACSYSPVHPEARTVVYFHGNGEVVADYLPGFAEWFNRASYSLLLAEYRGYGMSGGTPALAGMLDDGELVGSEHAEMLHDAAREPKQLTIFAQGGHNDIFYRNQAEYQRLVEAFLKTV